jgi:hypothetical protein
MILPEWRACGFSELEHVIKNGFKALPPKCFLHIDMRARKSICWHRIKIITLFPIGDSTLMQLMFNALDGGKFFVHTLWNWLLARCSASRPDAETRSCIVRNLLILFIDCNTASYLGSSALLKVWCWIQVICTLLVKCQLNCVRNALNRNSTVLMCLFEGSGSDYVHW